MVTIRAARWPDDEAALGALDPSFTTDRVYRVERGRLALGLVVESIDPPLRQTRPSLDASRDEIQAAEHVVVAEDGEQIVGLAAARLERWNRRVRVEGICVAEHARGRGIGRALMDSVVAFAREIGSTVVWLETQNTNYPAVQFYLRLGFVLCGLDARLYDPATPAGRETALFFALDLAP